MGEVEVEEALDEEEADFVVVECQQLDCCSTLSILKMLLEDVTGVSSESWTHRSVLPIMKNLLGDVTNVPSACREEALMQS